MYCDDDIIASYNWLKEILKCYSTFPNCGACGGRIIAKWEEEPKNWIADFSKDLKNIAPLSILDNGDGLFKLNNFRIYGCNFSVKKSLILQMNGTPPDAYPSNLRHLNGDGEIGVLKMVKNFGYDIIYNSEACVQHFIPSERNTKGYFKKRYEEEAIRYIYSIYRDCRGIKLRFCYLLTKSIFKSICLMIFKYPSVNDKKFYLEIRYNYEKIKISHGLRVLLHKTLQNHILKQDYLFHIC